VKTVVAREAPARHATLPSFHHLSYSSSCHHLDSLSSLLAAKINFFFMPLSWSIPNSRRIQKKQSKSRMNLNSSPFRLQDFHLLWFIVPKRFVYSLLSTMMHPTTPILNKQNRFRLFPFRSPLLGESHSLSSPPLT